MSINTARLNPQGLSGRDARQDEMKDAVEIQQALHHFAQLPQPRKLIDLFGLVGHVEGELQHLLHVVVASEDGRDGVVVLAQIAVGANERDFGFAVLARLEALPRRTDGALGIAKAVELVTEHAFDVATAAEPFLKRPVDPHDLAAAIDQRETGADDLYDVVEFLLFAEEFLTGSLAFGDVEQHQGVADVAAGAVVELAHHGEERHAHAVAAGDGQLLAGDVAGAALLGHPPNGLVVVQEIPEPAFSHDRLLALLEELPGARSPEGDDAVEVGRENGQRHVFDDQGKMRAPLLGKFHRPPPEGDILDHDQNARSLRHVRLGDAHIDDVVRAAKLRGNAGENP